MTCVPQALRDPNLALVEELETPKTPRDPKLTAEYAKIFIFFSDIQWDIRGYCLKGLLKTEPPKLMTFSEFSV